MIVFLRQELFAVSIYFPLVRERDITFQALHFQSLRFFGNCFNELILCNTKDALLHLAVKPGDVPVT